MSFAIMTDSAANLPEEMIDKYSIEVLPLSFFVDEEEYSGYVKGQNTDLSQFYQMMREKVHVKTSLVNIESAGLAFEEVLKSGKDVLYLGFSSGLSGTYQAVSIVLEELKEAYPNNKIFYIDTLSAALGEGLLVRYVIDLRENGKTIEEAYQWVADNRLKLCHWFTVEDLFFLKRGGRLSTAAAIFGSALSIKPVMHVDNEGHLIVIEKARGRKKSLDSLYRYLEENIVNPELQYVAISHGDCLEDAEYLADKVKNRFHVKEMIVNILDPVIGAHSGPGTVALFFLAERR
ncbi:DegV family protein [Anaeromicropila populeti]|uniref:EDD domain protein, DegV family n=1 Tax=Anaeromicropila populeti TaxID=37658 RepID=A0A1I6KI41_9FIRM|nr:DegV family protein [Anaeromicropila populeti]SFR90893.1 EDD domain protein, DegV family [Anaeromicropila populeti]